MLRVLLILSLIASTASAQTASDTPAPVAVSNHLVSSDTLQATHNLFKQKRAGGELMFGAAALLTVSGIVATTSTGYLNKVNQTIGFASLFSAAIFSLTAITKLDRFSEAQENRIITNYILGKSLPIYVKRQVKLQHFLVLDNK